MTYRDRVTFLVVYIREAHALDGRAPSTAPGDPLVEEPLTIAERGDVATTCVSALALPIPVLVDGIDNAVAKAYAAAPDRLYLVGRDGHVAYQGGPGPFEFSPDALEAAIRAELEATSSP